MIYMFKIGDDFASVSAETIKTQNEDNTAVIDAVVLSFSSIMLGSSIYAGSETEEESWQELEKQLDSYLAAIKEDFIELRNSRK